ncbi:MAG: DUF2249 domain-containing protein [Stellaceae bacterium]
MNGPAETRLAQRLDLRGLDPPEPMQRALEAVEALGHGGVLEVITDRDPLLLYRELARRGHPYASESRSDGFHTTIRRPEGESAP